MTKQEYGQEEQKLRDSYVCDSDYYPRLVDLDSEYIASLEAENQRLTDENDAYRKGHDFDLMMQNADDEVRLRADNARLERAVEKAMQKLMNGCPTDAYPCPSQLERESLYKRCVRCWKQYLMGDE